MRKSHTCFDITEWTSNVKSSGRFFQILWPSRNALTLICIGEIYFFLILSFSPKIHLCSCSTIEKKCEIGSQLLPGHNFNIYSRMVFPTWWEGGEGTKGIVNSNRQKSSWSFSCRRRGMYILWNQTIFEVAYKQVNIVIFFRHIS